MKSTGIIRPVDKMGRIVIPKEIRAQLNVTSAEDSFEIYMEEDAIILKKHETSCIFCGNGEDCMDYNGRPVCTACIDRLFDMKQNIKELEELSLKNLL